MSIPLQKALDLGIYDLNAVSEESKLKVYKLTLEEILNLLLHKDLETLPKKTLKDLKDGLRETIQVFFILRNSKLGMRLNLSEVIPIISDANSHLLAASSILETAGKTVEYFQYLQVCRDRIYETLEQLQEQ